MNQYNRVQTDSSVPLFSILASCYTYTHTCIHIRAHTQTCIHIRAHTQTNTLSLSLLARSFTHLLLPTHSPTYNYLFTFVDIPLEPFLAKLASNIANARLPKPACIPSSVWSWSSRESRRRGGYSIDNYRIGEIWCTETQREHKCESSWYQHHRKVMRKESAWVGVEVGVGWGGSEIGW